VSGTDLRARADGLRSGRTPFVQATVVRAERPTSAKAGDRALVLPDGTIEGFVGGSCAESTVRLQGLRLLRTGESTLLRITPDAGESEDVSEGLVTVGNPCLSGGTLEIFLEAMMPPTLVHVFGDAPVARALAAVGEAVGYEMRLVADPDTAIAPDTDAVVVASHGRDEERVLAAALSAGVGYVALVASRRRGAAVLAGLGVPGEQRARVRTPAGLDIGARSPQEVALSVLAEFVATRAAQVGHRGRVDRSEGRVGRSEGRVGRSEGRADRSEGRADRSEVAQRVGPSERSEYSESPEPMRRAERVERASPGGAGAIAAVDRAEAVDRAVAVDRAGAVDRAEAVDPVCGMTVAVVAGSLAASHGGRTWYFCGPGCRQAFVDDPGRYPG
jgi:xanthine dehydrogenase accessory factor